MDELMLKLKALADPTRLKILEVLRQTCEPDFCKKESSKDENGTPYGISISQTLGLTQPTVSHHMKVLVEAGLVEATRSGNTVFYCLDGKGFEALLEFARIHRDAGLAQEGDPDEGA